MAPARKTMIDKLLDRRRITDAGCWEYTGSLMTVGYGAVPVSKGKTMGAHRAAWEVWRGPIPVRLCVCHTCDNRKCFNPDHLWLGTKKQNTADMVAKGRHYSHPRELKACPRGHPYSGVNANGARICHTCARDLMRRHREEKRNERASLAQLCCD